MTTIEWPEWRDIANDTFLPCINIKDRFVIFWGGRDSGKSHFTADWLIWRCLNEPYFRLIMVRRYYAWVKNSQYQTIMDRVEELGISHLFHFKISPVEITCINGNKFIGAGTDDVKRIKSVRDPTGCWYEEDIVDILEDDWITISTTVRTSKKGAVLQDVYSMNPEVEGSHFEDNWFYQRFFEGHYPEKKTFRTVTTLPVPAEIAHFPQFKNAKTVDGNKVVEMKYTAHHSTYKDNRFITADRLVLLMDIQQRHEYYGTIYVAGLWGNKDSTGLFYSMFRRNRQVFDVDYDPSKSLHITWDFNVRPHISVGFWQVYKSKNEDPVLWESIEAHQHIKKRKLKKILVKVDELAAVAPRNRTKLACEDIVDAYFGHGGAVYVYGDATAASEDTRTEKGGNDYKIVMRGLSKFNPRMRVPTTNPNVAKRGEFVNEIFLFNEQGVAIVISPRCKKSLEDYAFGKEDEDGNKFKKRIKGEDDVPFEQYHHFSDADDYFICRFLKDEFNNYLRGGRKRKYIAGSKDREFERS